MPSFYRVILLVSALISGGASVHAEEPAVALDEIAGVVQVQSRGAEGWALVKRVPLDMAPGDMLRTGFGARAVLTMSDGSRVELGGSANLTLEETGRYRTALDLGLGAIKVRVKKSAWRSFQVRSPSAVCSVRGAAEFRVEALMGGRTAVDLYKGLLGAEDKRGQSVLMHPNEHLEIDQLGLSVPSAIPTPTQARRSQFHEIMRRELALDMSKEAVQSSAAREIKLAEYQQGKALIDVNGQRVRVEQYVMRPASNQFKFVALNGRADRFDYFYYLGTFNQALPRDLSGALAQLPGRADAAPDYWLTGYETGRSNTRDSLIELAQGGHPVDVNNNADPGDDVAWLFDRESGRYLDVAGRPVFQTLFDRYGFYVNGALKYGWTGSGIESYSQAASAFLNDPITGAVLPAALPVRSVTVTFPEADRTRQTVYESYGDGTFIRWDDYAINGEGRVAAAADFSARSGPGFKQRLLDFNYEQVITATEFGGRKIDLVVAPKVLIQSGLMP